MKQIAYLMIFYLGLSLWNSSAQISPQQIEKNWRENRDKRLQELAQGIVVVQGKETGAGIVVSSSPREVIIVTARHVVEESQSVQVQFYATKPQLFKASPIPAECEGNDVAVLRVTPADIPKLPDKFPEYRFEHTDGLQKLDQVYTVDSDWRPVPNSVSNLSHDSNANLFEYTNTSVGPGLSGGPVFDQYGSVVGVHTLRGGNSYLRFGAALRIEAVFSCLKEAHVTVPPLAPFGISVTDLPHPRPQQNAPSNAAANQLADMQLYRTAILSRDPAQMEAAANKISNQMMAQTLRNMAQAYRSAAQPATSPQTPTSPQKVPESRREMQSGMLKAEANSYARRGNYVKALPLYRQAADAGDSEAMVAVGSFYYKGVGIPKDYAQAAHWYEKAANEGETSVMALLGQMYAFGEGVPKDDAAAVDWDRKSADAGHAEGMLGLGFMYENGRGVPKDLQTAIEWYRKSANLGNQAAQENLRRLGVAR
jgi:TPR repeat protein